MTRRMFEHLALLFFPVAYAGGLLAAALNFLMPLPRRPRQSKLELDQKRAYFDDASEPVELELNGKKIYVLKVGDSLRAFDARCTHLDCNVRWKEGAFVCPCHNGQFNASGEVTRKPSPTPLQEFVIKVDDESGVVVVYAKYLKKQA